MYNKMRSGKIWQAQDKLNNGGMRMEQAHHCSFKVCCLQQRIKTNGIKPVACTTAHLMHPRNRMNKMNKQDQTGEKREKGINRGKIRKNTWKSLKKLLKVREDFKHGNGYEIKIIKFGERNLCKRCYLA